MTWKEPVFANGQIIVVCILVIILESAKHIINPLANYMNSEDMTLSSASRQNLRNTEKRERSNGQKVSNLKDDVQEINAWPRPDTDQLVDAQKLDHNHQ